jgi:hypothetical protein
MMSEHEIDWMSVRNRIEALFRAAASQLDEDAKAFVAHQLDHDEYETALEGLCLSFTILPDAARRLVDWDECKALSRLLKLDVESVLDPDFWEKLSGAAADTGQRPPIDGK